MSNRALSMTMDAVVENTKKYYFTMRSIFRPTIVTATLTLVLLVIASWDSPFENEYHENVVTAGNPPNSTNTTLPPLILVSSPCSGSSFVIKFAQQLVRRHVGIDAYMIGMRGLEHEYLAISKSRANPSYNYTLAKTDKYLAGKQMVLNVYGSISRNSSQAMITKLLQNHITPGVVPGLQELNARFVSLYRQNLLEKSICGIKDCFLETKGHFSVFENGTQSRLCFLRRKHPELSILGRFDIQNYSKQMESIMHSYGCKEGLRDPKVKIMFDKEMHYNDHDDSTENYPRLALDRLEAFEYAEQNSLEFNASVADWKRFLKGWGIEPRENLILEEMRIQGINVRNHSKAMNSIYNKDEVAGLFQKWARHDNEFCDWKWMMGKRGMNDGSF